jgi:membrane-bound serine protease (ClpP class)
MKSTIRRAFIAGLCSLIAYTASAAGNTVVVLEIKGGIGVATADYLASGIRRAEEQNAELIIIDIDTPGGLVKPMRDMVQDILGSSVPVATYVTPAGARADSAGTYILLASHIAAMSPTTHLGAATPVSLNGEDVTPPNPGGESLEKPADSETEGDEESTEPEPAPMPGSAMERKVLNDAVAYIRGLAERHGRATDHADLLQQLDGFEVKMDSQQVALETGDATIEEFEPNWRIKILSAIANPEIVLLLGIIGLYGLMYEGWNPGAIVPGVVGVICLLLAAYALQVLPVNYAGLALIIVGIALMTAEAFAPSFGALGLGGIAAFVFGAIMMFDSDVPGFGISVGFVIGLAILAALAIIWLVGYALKLRRRGAVSGRGSIIGGMGTAVQDFTGDGKVWLEGEAWAAHSNVPIRKDQQVVVRAMKGLTLEVEPTSEPDPGDAQLQT